jgi:hypothetical protein
MHVLSRQNVSKAPEEERVELLLKDKAILSSLITAEKELIEAEKAFNEEVNRESSLQTTATEEGTIMKAEPSYGQFFKRAQGTAGTSPTPPPP